MVGRSEQGRISGAMQSLQSLGWIVGPLVGGFVYTAWGHFQAYASASFMIVLAIVCLWIALPRLRRDEAKEQARGEHEATCSRMKSTEKGPPCRMLLRESGVAPLPQKHRAIFKSVVPLHTLDQPISHSCPRLALATPHYRKWGLMPSAFP